jgi:Ca2+-binding EF-hand superfamily protein
MRAIHIVRPCVLAATLAYGLLCPSAQAQTQTFDENRLRSSFATADRNHSGTLDIDEYVGHMILLVATFDRNGDHYLVAAELRDNDPARFRMADRDGDGRLSVGEIVAAKVIDYFDMDTNHDGVLSVEEVLVFERARAPKR